MCCWKRKKLTIAGSLSSIQLPPMEEENHWDPATFKWDMLFRGRVPVYEPRKKPTKISMKYWSLTRDPYSWLIIITIQLGSIIALEVKDHEKIVPMELLILNLSKKHGLFQKTI